MAIFGIYRTSDGAWVNDYSDSSERVSSSSEVHLEVTGDVKPASLKAVQAEDLSWSLEADATKVTFANNEMMSRIRASRNMKLQQCDWTQLSDSPLGSTPKADWVSYRQALRDLPESININSINNISDVTWPTEPA